MSKRTIKEFAQEIAQEVSQLLQVRSNLDFLNFMMPPLVYQVHQ